MGGEITGHHSSSKPKESSDENCGNRTIYLHLKKFFRGARFTSQPFLRSLQQKNKEGDFVCVSGKVSFCNHAFSFYLLLDVFFINMTLKKFCWFSISE